MKKALLIYKTNPTSNIFNIGDYIQSLAAAQFFQNQIDCYINREELDSYKGDEVKLIMNGWFMHEPTNWPPSDKIHPLFVAFHLNTLALDKLTSEESITYFKKHQPIGCRDYNTVHILQSHGVNAYFTGCMTLTLDLNYRYSGIRNEEIYFTDVPYIKNFSLTSISNVLFFLLFHIGDTYKICKRKYLKVNLLNIMRSAFFGQQYSHIFDIEVLKKANYIEQEIEDSFKSDQDKFAYAEALLNKYAKAKFVVTSRIHCALPCLSLETPVLFVYDINQNEISSCRMKGLIELFHVIKINKNLIQLPFSEGKIGIKTRFTNKKDYLPLRDSLIKRCRDFCRMI